MEKHPPLLVHGIVVKKQDVAGLRLQLPQHFLQGAGEEAVVAVQEKDEFSLRRLQAGIARGAQAAVFLVDHPQQLRKAPGVVLGDPAGAVGGAVVHGDDLVVPPPGEDHRIQAGGEIVLHPIHGDHDAELAHGPSPPQISPPLYHRSLSLASAEKTCLPAPFGV